MRLKYAPVVENAPRFAADIVTSAAVISGVTLDFSVASLQAVDDIVEGMRRDGCTPDQIAEILFGFGCYVGEVFVRNAGWTWRNTAETSMAKLAGFPIVIALRDTVCNPIGKVFKRLENGAQDNLQHFYGVFNVERPSGRTRRRPR